MPLPVIYDTPRARDLEYDKRRNNYNQSTDVKSPRNSNPLADLGPDAEGFRAMMDKHRAAGNYMDRIRR